MRRLAAIDLDRLRLERVCEADDVGAIGAVQRQPVAQHEDAAFDRVLLQAGATDLDAWLVVAAEEFLHHDAGRVLQGLGQRRIATLRNVLRRQQSRAPGGREEALPNEGGHADGGTFDDNRVENDRGAGRGRLGEAGLGRNGRQQRRERQPAEAGHPARRAHSGAGVFIAGRHGLDAF